MCPACTSPPGCTSVLLTLDLHRHYVLFAVHFYGCLDGPVVLTIVLGLGWLSVGCLVADPLLLVWSAQPVVFFFGVYHVWDCSFVLH